MPLTWAETIAGHVLSITAVFGNGLVIYLIATRRRLRTTTNWFVLSLALADFGFPASFPARHHVRLGVAANLLRRLLAHGSIVNLGVLTLDRYIAITNPFRYVSYMTAKRVALLICLAWMVPFLLIIVDITLNDYGHVVFHFAVMPVIAVFTLIATARIFLIVKKHLRQNAAVLKQLSYNYVAGKTKVLEPPEVCSAKMVYIMVSVFLIYSSTNAFYVSCDSWPDLCSSRLKEKLFACNELLTLLNAIANPVAYAFCKREMRRELKRMVAAFKRFCLRVLRREN